MLLCSCTVLGHRSRPLQVPEGFRRGRESVHQRVCTECAWRGCMGKEGELKLGPPGVAWEVTWFYYTYSMLSNF